jgi:hypothetical protein
MIFTVLNPSDFIGKSVSLRKIVGYVWKNERIPKE